MEKDLVTVLEDISKKISKVYTGNKKSKYEKEITRLTAKYRALEIPEELNETYESLKNRGRELLKEANINNEKKVDYYLRYCEAAIYDFKGNMKPLNTILKSFLLTAILFFALSPQYFSFILPLIFIIPVFLGLRGIKQRSLNGLMIGVSVVPMAILVSTVWLRNAVLTMGNFSEFVNSIAQHYKFSYEFTKNLTIASIALSVVMLGSSITLLVSAIKHRKMFI